MAELDDMQPNSSSTKLTFEDYRLFPDDGRRHELIDGEHYVTPSPVTNHQRISRCLLFEIEFYLRAHPIGEVFCAPFTTILTQYDVVEPDLLYVSNERRDVIQEWIRGAPDLVVEILSPSSRKLDEVTKRRLFERTGVAEYWVVDPELKAVTVHRRDGDRFVRVAELGRDEGAVLTTPLLPGFELGLDRLFA